MATNKAPKPADEPSWVRVSVRLNPAAAEHLLFMAGGEKNKGAWLSDMIMTAWENRNVTSTITLSELRTTVRGLMLDVAELRAAIQSLETRMDQE